ncbi:MAG: hypothetical protein WD266_00115 [Balneolales bacterium]
MMKKLLSPVLVLCFPILLHAQLIVGGLVDVEFRKGQLDSSPVLNQTPNDKLNIYTPYIRLFGLGVISDQWFAEMGLQADYYQGDALSPVFFSLININWLPLSDSEFMISAGRFVTPYGSQSERVLSSENPFVHLPLSHVWNLGVDRKTGIFFDEPDYENDALYGQSMIYQRMYSQGIKFSNKTAQQKLFYEFAVTMAAASSYLEVGSHNKPAFMGRMTYQPAIWARLGSSFSYGPYMIRDPLNSHISSADLQSYNQLLYGADVTVSHLYYSFSIEANISQWTSPDYAYEDILINEPLAVAAHYSAEMNVQFPFLAGAYTAVRGEILRPGEIRQRGQSTSYNNYYPLGPKVDRAEFVVGYRLNPTVRTKASYLIHAISPDQTRANVLTMQLSVGF